MGESNMNWETILKLKVDFRVLKEAIKRWSNQNKHREVTTEQVLNEIIDDYIANLKTMSAGAKGSHRKGIMTDTRGIRQTIAKILRGLGWEKKKSKSVIDWDASHRRMQPRIRGRTGGKSILQATASGGAQLPDVWFWPPKPKPKPKPKKKLN
jgi:hypothetical protein